MQQLDQIREISECAARAWVLQQYPEIVASRRFIGGTQAPSMAWRTFMTMLGAWHGQGFAMFSVLERDRGAIL